MGASKIIIAQVDHSSGEVIGHSIQRLFRIGARNVQVLQSITKKNRPGYMLFIDAQEEVVEEIAVFLGVELGIWGYHILESNHVHFDVSFQEKTIILAHKHHTEEFTIKIKYIRNRDKLLRVKVDHDHLVQMQERLEGWGAFCSIDALRALIESRLSDGESEGPIIITAACPAK